MGGRIVLTSHLRQFLLFALLLGTPLNGLLASSKIEKKVIEEDLLGQEIYSLYEKFNFIAIETNNEYADLQAGENYWLVVDSRHEYFTLRTINEVVVEAIVRNPDLETKRGIKVGDSFDHFMKIYPDAKRLTHYQTGVSRRGIDFLVESESIEVNFNIQETVEAIRLRNLDSLHSREHEH